MTGLMAGNRSFQNIWIFGERISRTSVISMELGYNFDVNLLKYSA
jgi:hypothetical protein